MAIDKGVDRVIDGFKRRGRTRLGAGAALRVAAGQGVLLAALLALGACGDGDGGSERGGWGGGRGEPTRIVAHAVTLEPAGERVEAVGTARARRSATLYPDTGGEVRAVLFDAGDRVAADQPLLRLEAEAEELAVRLAEVAVSEAEQLLARYRRIEDTGAVSDSQIDEARTSLDAARIQLAQARLALDKRTVRAPFAGVVGLTEIDAGARITSQTAITDIDDRSLLFVDFEAPEQVFANLAPGDTVQLSPFSAPDGTYEATVAKVGSRIDPDTRTFTVRAELENAADDLRPGMSFRARFTLPGRAYPAVPETAILWGSDGSYLWAVREGKATRTPVTIVARRAGIVLVDADLGRGDHIVAEGVQKVREGTDVTDVGPLAQRGEGRPGNGESNGERDGAAGGAAGG